MDNAKFIMVVFVVTIHVSHWHFGKRTWPASAVTKALGFQMPLLCMISGATSPTRLTVERLVRMLVPCVVFGNLMPAQYWLLWYLRCLVLWRLAALSLDRVPGAGQAVLVSAVGIASAYASVSDSWVGPEAAVDAIRAGAMLPYFTAGRWLALVLRTPGLGPGPGLRALAWAAFVGFLAAYIAYEPTVDRWLFRASWWTEVLWFSDVCRHCFKVADHVWARYIADVVLNSVLGLLFFFLCVPRSCSWLSRCGGRTLYPYVLHDQAIWLLLAPGRRLLAAPERLWHKSPLLAAWWTAALWLSASLALALLLSSWPSRAVFRWAVEPEWLVALLRVRWQRQSAADA